MKHAALTGSSIVSNWSGFALLFRLEGSLYAADALAVREIALLPQVTAVQGMPAYVAGVVNYRGAVVPVVDLSVRLGQAPQNFSAEDNLVVLSLEGSLVALVVSQVVDVRPLAAIHIESLPHQPDCSPGEEPLVAGMARLENDLVSVLRLESLMLPLSQWQAAPGADASVAMAGFQEAMPLALQELASLRARQLMSAIGEETSTGLLPLAVVALQDEYWGVDLGLVREFTEIRNLVPVPCCPPHILGQMNLRGDMLTLVDVRGTLQLAKSRPVREGQAMVVEMEGGRVGVWIEAVSDVVYLRSADVSPVPAATASTAQEYVRGTTHCAGHVLGLLDLRKVLELESLMVHETV